MPYMSVHIFFSYHHLLITLLLRYVIKWLLNIKYIILLVIIPNYIIIIIQTPSQSSWI